MFYLKNDTATALEEGNINHSVNRDNVHHQKISRIRP